MKTYLRGIIFVLFTVVGGMVLLIGNAQAGDDALPPEVKALIGMKIPSKIPGVPGSIPRWLSLWGAGIVNTIYFDELQRENITILTIELIDTKDQTISILDARVISRNPKELQYYVKDGKPEQKNDLSGYMITSSCQRKNSEENELILGMWRFDSGPKCGATSTLVKKAWLLDPKSGRLTDIPSKGVFCRDPDGGNCGE